MQDIQFRWVRLFTADILPILQVRKYYWDKDEGFGKWTDWETIPMENLE